MDRSASEPGGSPTRVLIAGGGVAALEAMLALRALAGERVHTSLLAPDPLFRYRPLSVAEPFADVAPRHLDLAEITLENDATFMRESLASVDPDQRVLVTGGGRRLEYDALLIAIGARGGTSVPGALAFWDSADRGAFREVLAELDAGTVRSLTFAVPGKVAWPLGLYELALLTSAHLAKQGRTDTRLAFVTPEAQPMAVFGEKASAAVAALMSDAGIDLRLNSMPVRFEDGQLSVEGGPALRGDRVVSLPIPEVPPIPGLPQDEHGFIPVDRYCGVLGLERVYAAGDATTFPVKQGGVATQAADSAATAIAELAGAPVDPQPFRPVLRGALLTGAGPRYMRTDALDASDTVSRSTLWWPPAKVAGKYLAPYLASRAGYKLPKADLVDLEPPPGEDPTVIDTDRDDIVAMALATAKTDAAERRFGSALRWLEVVEDLQLYLPREYELDRAAWQELARRGRKR